MSFLSEGLSIGRVKRPHLVLLYGTDSVGKSTFAASMPKPYFLDLERGTLELDVRRVHPDDLVTVYRYLDSLATDGHEYQTVVIDSLDWLEPLVWRAVCAKQGWDSIESPGFGKGYVAALDEWKVFRDKLQTLRDVRKMNVCLLAHAHIKMFQDPATNAGYDRYQIKLHDRSASLLREFCDAVLFATFETFAKTEKNGKAKVYGDGARIMYTERRPQWDAKNRFSLPFQMPLSWDEYERAIESKDGEKPESLIASIVDMSKELDPKIKANVQKKLKEFGADSTKLLDLKNKIITALNTP